MKIKKIIKINLRKIGYKIVKINKQITTQQTDNKFTMKNGIERCCERGLEVNTVIDVGASNSSWSRECMLSIPNANYFLIEAQLEHEEGLLEFKNRFSKGDYMLAVAGHKNGKIYFDKSDLFGGIASDRKINKNYIEVPMVSLDSEIKKRNLQPPYLLKLDTHGFEIPILEGAQEILKKANLVIIETYNYKITDGSLKFYDLCKYMESVGFYPIEMVDFMLREHDNSFWQMDTFFIPNTNKSFECNSYK